MRQALRVLEANALIDVRIGSHGGAFVTSPDPARLGEGLADLLQLSPLAAAEVTEARMVFELSIVPLVVERATDDDLAALERLCEQQQTALGDERYTMEVSGGFHVRVAACTHNTAVEMPVGSFHSPLLMSLKEARIADPVMGYRGAREHLEFGHAVRRHATAQADASGAAVTAETDRIRDTLLANWDSERLAVREAAQVVLDGPGRLQLRRTAVNRAGQQLVDWADVWRPYLPAMPTDPQQIARLADRSDDRPRL